MKKPAYGTALLLLAAFHAGIAIASDSGADTPDPAVEQVRAAEQAFADAFAARNLELFASLIHDDAVFTGRDGPLQGKAAVLDVWSRFFDAQQAPFSWAPERVVVSPDGTLGSTTGPVRDPDGHHVGAFASTWMRQADGTWQVLFDISPACPPPAQ